MQDKLRVIFIFCLFLYFSFYCRFHFLIVAAKLLRNAHPLGGPYTRNVTVDIHWHSRIAVAHLGLEVLSLVHKFPQRKRTTVLVVVVKVRVVIKGSRRVAAQRLLGHLSGKRPSLQKLRLVSQHSQLFVHLRHLGRQLMHIQVRGRNLLASHLPQHKILAWLVVDVQLPLPGGLNPVVDEVRVMAARPVLQVYKGAQRVRPVASVEEIDAVNETNAQIRKHATDRLLVPPIGNIGNVERHEISAGRHC